MTVYQDRLLEIHGPNMFNLFHVDRAIAFAKNHGMTGLIFHCNELIDRVVLPSHIFSNRALIDARWGVRDATLENNRYYMRTVLTHCKKAGLEFYAEVKELNFPRDMLELVPFILKENGAVCPTETFWREFLISKYHEFFQLLPDVAGIIVSLGSRESGVSISANGCVCERCRAYDKQQWYKELIEAMYQPISEAGKKLIVRDFASDIENQYFTIDAAQSVSKDIIIAMKKAPHDYYPTFPDNPVVGRCKGMRQWIEIDTWGQFFGLSVFPCSVIEDLKGRMERYAQKDGVCGVMLRTDWEIISQSSIFNSFNIVNLIGCAMLAQNPDTSLEEIYHRWFTEGLFSPLIADSYPQEACVPSSPGAERILTEFMKDSWKVLEKITYTRGHVFQRCVQFFRSVQEAFDNMVALHKRDDWDPGASHLVSVTNGNMEIIFAEKAEGLALLDRILDTIRPDELGVTDEIREYLVFMKETYPFFARVMADSCTSVYLIRKAQATHLKEDIIKAEESILPFQGYIDYLHKNITCYGYPNLIEWILSEDRLTEFLADARAQISNIPV